MILLAVIIGYLLGIAPFVVPKIVEIIQNRRMKADKELENKEQNEIFDEWLNGAKQESKKINQQDIYNEYITGEVTMKGE